MVSTRRSRGAKEEEDTPVLEVAAVEDVEAVDDDDEVYDDDNDNNNEEKDDAGNDDDDDNKVDDDDKRSNNIADEPAIDDHEVENHADPDLCVPVPVEDQDLPVDQQTVQVEDIESTGMNATESKEKEFVEGADAPNATVNPAAKSSSNEQGSDSYALMVNFLPPSIDEGKMKEMFGKSGDLESVRLIIDRATGKNIGYGFVNFLSLEGAKAAVEKYNGFSIDGKRLKVAWSKSASDGTKRGQLYVTGLPIFYTEEHIRKMFGQFGKVFEVKILMNEQNESRGVSFVMVTSLNDAHLAIEKLNNSIPEGGSSRIVVKLAIDQNHSFGTRGRGRGGNAMLQGGYGPLRHDPRSFRADPYALPAPHRDGYCLFTYNFTSDVDETALAALFAPYGIATGVKVMRDEASGKSRGFGFVNLPTLEQATAAIAGLNGKDVGGRILKVDHKKQKGSVSMQLSPPADVYGRNALSTFPYAVAPPPYPHMGPAQHFGAAYQRALAEYHHAQQTGGDTVRTYNVAMQAYASYQQAYAQQSQGIMPRRPY